eukprot:CAMPEP_0185592252 /NCGR_PEP_ID=MMETSP0434-20130131/67330_1 /TAXON_ID=626734 ORGANISM="Favella taraikaensis, Strain Fe Narragansett Bay" /NCGR_SAMPLE_ID=MMETSP0434 /ASSEMBLY_ACC=CAM_ASM_000379 /LENGTH=69 /DNA_ID=CAMNT_0028217919 /DNA_START=95 /DNA_END=301 /DNA_ORIENTATION=+
MEGLLEKIDERAEEELVCGQTEDMYSSRDATNAHTDDAWTNNAPGKHGRRWSRHTNNNYVESTSIVLSP